MLGKHNCTPLRLWMKYLQRTTEVNVNYMNCLVEALGRSRVHKRITWELLLKYRKATEFCQFSNDFISCDIYKNHTILYAFKIITKISIRLGRICILAMALKHKIWVYCICTWNKMYFIYFNVTLSFLIRTLSYIDLQVENALLFHIYAYF